MATVASLLVRIGANTKDLESGLKGASDSLRRTGDRMSKLGGSMTKFVTGPIAALSVGMVALAKKSGNFADKLLDLSEQTGLTTDTLQEYRAVATDAGVDQDAVADSAIRLVRELGKIRDGTGDAAKALEELDVSVTNADDSFRDMDDIMPEIITELQGMDNELERNQLAFDIFGRRAEELIPILAQNTDETEKLREEARELGLVIDKEALEAANDFRKMMDRMREQISLTFTAIGADLVPVLQESLVPAFENFVIPALRLAAELLGELIQWFAGLSGQMQFAIAAFVGLAAAAGPVLIIAGQLVGAVGTLVGAFSTIYPVIQGVALAIGGLGAAKIALVALIAGAVIAIIRNWEQIANAAGRVWSFIADVVTTQTRRAASFVVDTYNTLANAIRGISDNIAQIIRTAMQFIRDTAFSVNRNIALFISEQWNNIADFFWGTLHSIRDMFVNLFGEMTNIVFGWVRSVVGALNAFAETVLGIFGRFGEGLLKTVSAPLDGVRNRFEEMRKGTTRESKRAKDENVAEAEEQADGLAKHSSTAKDEVVANFEDLSEDTIKQLKAMGIDIDTISGDITQDMIDDWEEMGIEIPEITEVMVADVIDEYDSLDGEVRRSYGDLVDFVINETKGKSRTLDKLYDKLGEDTLISFSNLRDDSSRVFDEFAGDLIDTAFDAALRVGASLLGIQPEIAALIISVADYLVDWEDVWNGFVRVAKGAWGLIGTFTKLAGDLIVGVFKTIGDIGSRVWGGIKNVVGGAASAIKNAGSTIARGVRGIGRSIRDIFNPSLNIENGARPQLIGNIRPDLIEGVNMEGINVAGAVSGGGSEGRSVNITQNFTTTISKQRVQMATERALRKVTTNWQLADGRIV